MPGRRSTLALALGAAAVVAGSVVWGLAGGTTTRHLSAPFDKRAIQVSGSVCLEARANGLIEYARRTGWMNNWTHGTVTNTNIVVRAFEPDCATPIKVAFSKFAFVQSGSRCTWMTHATCGGSAAFRQDTAFARPVTSTAVGNDGGYRVPFGARSYVGSAPAACVHFTTWVAGTRATRPFNAAFDLAACTPRP